MLYSILAILAVGLFAWQVVGTAMWRTARLNDRRELLNGRQRDQILDLAATVAIVSAICATVAIIIFGAISAIDAIWHVDTVTQVLVIDHTPAADLFHHRDG